jgi:hypothetical protein
VIIDCRDHGGRAGDVEQLSSSPPHQVMMRR